MNAEFDRLTADLNADDVSTRWRAVEAIGQIDGDDALDILIQALAHSDSGVRWRAAQAIGRYKNPKAVEPLLNTLLHDSHSTAREYAALALGMLAETNAVEPLIHALEHDDAQRVVSAAVWSLAQIHDERAIRPLRMKHYYHALVDFGAAGLSELLDAFNTLPLVTIARGEPTPPFTGNLPYPAEHWIEIDKHFRLLDNPAELVDALEKAGWMPETEQDRALVEICLYRFATDIQPLVKMCSAIVPALINLMNSDHPSVTAWKHHLSAKVLREIDTPEARAAVEAWEARS